MDRSCLTQFLLLLQIATHTCSSCSSLFSLLCFTNVCFTNHAVIHDWMVSRVPTCKGAQNNEQELFQRFLTELAGLTQTLLLELQTDLWAEHTRKDNSIASRNSHTCKGFCTPGQTEPDVVTLQSACRTHLFHFSRTHPEKITVSQNLRISVSSSSETPIFTSVKVWGARK